MASVKMPQLGESITEGTISKWLKKPGDQVKKYEGLVEIITDKVNAEVPSPMAGVLKEIKVKEGTTVTIGTEIAVIEESVTAATPAAPTRGPEEVKSPAVAIPSTVAGAQPVPSPLAGEGQGGGSSESRTRLSPAVRALIEEHRITDAELSRIEGSGIGGRISKKDIEDFVAKRAQPATGNGEQRQKTATPPAATPGTTVPLSPMRRAIASNMLKSKQTIPHAWTVAEVDMTSVVRFRQAAKAAFRQREGIDLTFVPIIVKAVVEGLKAVPVLNASWSDEGVVLHKDINIGVAVSVDDGLIVPVVHQADRMSIAGLAKTIDDLATRARAGKLGIPDVQGGTFTVNNPGTFGTILSYSIIAPPQAGILAMDAIVKRPVVVEGDAIAVRSVMNLCLSFDHRVLDGVSAARFLQGVRRWLEGFSEQVPLY
ncbi:MAG TPA: dihydrolipoamide acetyltransferase family protein [Candidatus Dormibacteraeota bacterium]|nr:dihydrolipoamide acetyltransferase family protein [Candidatus Dormibacteraeota bacterium]